MAKAGGQDTGEKVDDADLIFHGGRIYTVDSGRSWSQAVAIRGGKIVAVGSDADVLKWRGAAAEKNVLAARRSTPGLLNAHTHHARGGAMVFYDVTFQAYHSFDEILKLVKARAEKLPAGEWICGGIWSSELIGRLRRMEAK